MIVFSFMVYVERLYSENKYVFAISKYSVCHYLSQDGPDDNESYFPCSDKTRLQLIFLKKEVCF